MNTWIKAGGIACLVEFFLLVAMRTMLSVNRHSFISDVLGWYHIGGAMFCNEMLLIWNPGPRQGPTPASNAVCLLSMYLFQAAVTTPIIFLLLKWIDYVRIHGKVS